MNIIQSLESMRDKPEIWFGPLEKCNVQAIHNVMIGYEIAKGITDNRNDRRFHLELSKRLRLGPLPATDKDISYRDAIEFAIELIKDRGYDLYE